MCIYKSNKNFSLCYSNVYEVYETIKFPYTGLSIKYVKELEMSVLNSCKCT